MGWLSRRWSNAGDGAVDMPDHDRCQNAPRYKNLSPGTLQRLRTQRACYENSDTGIPTHSFEIFAELCGCRWTDFLKNGVCDVYFSLRFMEEGMCSALVYLRAAFLVKLPCFIAYEPF